MIIVIPIPAQPHLWNADDTLAVICFSPMILLFLVMGFCSFMGCKPGEPLIEALRRQKKESEKPTPREGVDQ